VAAITDSRGSPGLPIVSAVSQDLPFGSPSWNPPKRPLELVSAAIILVPRVMAAHLSSEELLAKPDCPVSGCDILKLP
jgi:hypothetical protein